jgi:hypothetical protein
MASTEVNSSSTAGGTCGGTDTAQARGVVNSVIVIISKLEVICCIFLAENNFVNALIPIIGDRNIRMAFSPFGADKDLYHHCHSFSRTTFTRGYCPQESGGGDPPPN